MMVLVNALEATGVFPVLAHRLLLVSRGEGRRLLIGIVLLTSLICAWLPNATTVLLLGPLLPPMAREVKLDPRPLLILLVLSANSAGLLTLIGDPATYIVGTGIGLSFGAYLSQVSLAGVLSVLVLLVSLPWLYRGLWRARFRVPPVAPPRLHHRRALTLLLVVVAVMLGLFVTGDLLPVALTPDTVAMAGAATSLLIAHQSRLARVEQLLAKVDWSTLIYFTAVFVLIGGLSNTGVLAGLAERIAGWLSAEPGASPGTGSSLSVLAFTGMLSSVIPNIPLVAALTPVLQQSCQQGCLPLFMALMLGGTLGGNATLIGASANLVGAGIARQEGVPISFQYWLRYGIPTVMLQLCASAGWLLLH
jgi:Na+/H+ antiporter NhaD/arsenite permease-like protein